MVHMKHCAADRTDVFEEKSSDTQTRDGQMRGLLTQPPPTSDTDTGKCRFLRFCREKMICFFVYYGDWPATGGTMSTLT